MKVKLGDLIEEYSERNIDNKYKPVAVGKYGIRARESIYSKELAKDYSKNKLIYKGTLTIGMGSNQIDIGILRDDEIYSVSPAYHTYNIKISNYDYLDYLLTANNNRMFSIYANRGSRQGKTLDLKRWLTDELRLHDEKDQKIIVQTLNAVKQLISQKEAELVKLDNLIKARFVEMFGDKDETKISDYIDSLEAGKSLAGTEKCENKVLKTGAVSYDYFDVSQTKYLPKDYRPVDAHKINPGNIVISRMNTIELVGAAAYVWNVPDKIYLPDRLWKAKIKNDANPIFVWQTIIHPKTKELIRRIAGGTSGSMKNISKSKFLEMPVKKATREEQGQFAIFVTQIDKSKFVLSNELTMCDFHIRLIHDRVMHSCINLRVAQ